MFEAITNIFAQNPDQALDVLEWATFGSGIIIGCMFALVAYGFLILFHMWFNWLDDRKAKKSGKLTNEQRLELLEEKIDSLADIVISSSPEEK